MVGSVTFFPEMVFGWNAPQISRQLIRRVRASRFKRQSHDGPLFQVRRWPMKRIGLEESALEGQASLMGMAGVEQARLGRQPGLFGEIYRKFLFAAFYI
jgi:hypothetical protein